MTLSELEKRLEARSVLFGRMSEVQTACMEQRHLDVISDGAWSPERAYWHHGYMMACVDILNLIRSMKEKDNEGE